MHFIDNWQGENAQIKLDNQVQWVHSATKNGLNVNVCGGKDFQEAEFNVPVMIEVPHSQESLNIAF
jgi:hypothetical protein